MNELHPRDTERVTTATVTAALEGTEHGRIYRTRPGCVRVEYARHDGTINETAANEVVETLLQKREQEGWRVMPSSPADDGPGSGYVSIHDLAVWHPEGSQYLTD